MTFVTEWQRALHEDFRRLRAHRDQLCAREILQGRARGLAPGEITPDDSGINLANRCDRVTIAMIARINFVEALVSATKAECRKVRTVHAESLEQMPEAVGMVAAPILLGSARVPACNFRRPAGKPCSARRSGSCRAGTRMLPRSAPRQPSHNFWHVV
jgi:hypothetical protein